MHHHKRYMYINFQQNRVSTSVKTVHINLFAKTCVQTDGRTYGRTRIGSFFEKRKEY